MGLNTKTIQIKFCESTGDHNNNNNNKLQQTQHILYLDCTSLCDIYIK